jgi:HKD family nuclease
MANEYSPRWNPRGSGPENSSGELEMRVQILNQPDDHQLAALLKRLLGAPKSLKFDALVAFAVSSGVEQIQSELEALLGRGGRVRIVVGVSNRVTTIEGLGLLLELVDKGANVFVFHNDTYTNPIFHPKLYLVQEKESGVLIVGSNNMTGKGLVGNYEISLAHELDLKNNADAEFIASAERIVERYCDLTGGFSRTLDADFLQELEAEGYLGSEQAGTSKPETAGESETATTAPRKKLFASKSVPSARRTGAVRRAALKRQSAAPASAGPLAHAPAVTAVGRGPLLWEKKLTLTDAQLQPGHATGEVRLAQAKWRVRRRLIDQTTYFRRDLFGAFTWKPTKKRPYYREETSVRFEVIILGTNLGVHQLQISDKPSGEADQGNYTSALHWGNLGSTIRNAKVAGKMLRLYGPPAGSNEPFFIEIS